MMQKQSSSSPSIHTPPSAQEIDVIGITNKSSDGSKEGMNNIMHLQQQKKNHNNHNNNNIWEEQNAQTSGLEEFENILSRIKTEQIDLQKRISSKHTLSEEEKERRNIMLLLIEKYLREKGLSKSAEILRTEKQREQLEWEGFTSVKNQFSIPKELESNVDHELITQLIEKTSSTMEPEVEKLTITEFPYHRTMFTSHFEKIKHPSNNLELKLMRSRFDLENVLLSAAIKTNSTILNEKLGLLNNNTLDLSNLESLDLDLSKPIHSESILRYINAASADNMKPIDKICLMYQTMKISSRQFFNCLSNWLSSCDEKVTETKANAYRALKHWLQKYYLYYSKFDLEGVQSYSKITCTIRTFIRSNEGKLKRISQHLGDNFDLEKFVTRANTTSSYSQMLAMVERTIYQKMTRSTSVIDCITQIDTKSVVTHLNYLFGRLFLRIEPQELFGANWTKSRKKYQCPNITDNIDFFNTYSVWFASLIVREEKLERRVVVLEYLIHLAVSCSSVGNFGALYAIASAIRNGSVFRMKQTFESINEKSKQDYEKLQIIISTDMNSANYTKLLNSTYQKALTDFSLFCIPNLGKHFGELTLTEEGVQDKEQKTQKTYDLITTKFLDLQKQLLKSMSRLVLDHNVLNFILERGKIVKNQDELAVLSKQVEPAIIQPKISLAASKKRSQTTSSLLN